MGQGGKFEGSVEAGIRAGYSDLNAILTHRGRTEGSDPLCILCSRKPYNFF